MTDMTTTTYCTCPMERVYGQDEVCEFCRTVMFHDDPDYAEMMGFTLVDDKWVSKYE